jgi:TonB-dependent starch-binding outer membrane protein SusC
MKKHLSNSKKPNCMKNSSLVFRAIGLIALMLTMNFSAFASVEILLSERVQLQVDNVTLKDALKEIERQSEFTFLYNDASIDVNQVITVSTSELSVKELLDEILDNKGINYTIVDNQIVLTRALASKQTDKKMVSGAITDSETGEGLPGVSILEKGTSNGTITDLDGNFNLNVAENAVLVISYVGYVTEEISVAGTTSASIALIPDIIALDDVVVIGYGTVKKSDLTGAVASISADDMKQSAVSGLDQALQGRTAGVSITSNSGTPGAAPTINIRGMGTVTNPDPLFVIDGMPVTAAEVGNLNPGDVESTEILKDASAAAIYGARAGNGVVLITTKKGKAGKSSVIYDGYSGVQSVAKKMDLLSAEEYLTLRNQAGFTWEDSSAFANTDWQDEIFRDAGINSHQLSFIGGSENVRYAVVGSYFDQKGIIGQEYMGVDSVKAADAKGSDYTRYTFRVNTAADVKPWLTIGENISYSYSEQNTILEQDEWTSVVITALTIDPALPVYLPDTARAARPNPYDHYSGSYRNNVDNPVGTIMRNHNITKTNKLLGNVYVELKPVKWLSLKTTLGTEVTRDNNEQFFPEYYETVAHVRSVNNLFRGDYNTNHLLWENLVTFKKTFGEKHDIQAIAGYTRESMKYRYFAYMVQDVPENPELWFASNSSAGGEDNQFQDIADVVGNVTIPQSVPYDASLISYLGRVIYSYDRLIDFTGSIRRDGSSRFTGENKWGIFPSFAAGMKISELSFMKNQDLISFLKLRIGWGKLGNQEIRDYGAYTPITYTYNYTTGVYGSQFSNPGGAPTGIGNQSQTWEETVMTNLGLDVNLWDNILALNIDAYKRVTSDMLVAVPIPLVIGVQNAPEINRGEVVNTGIEFNLVHKYQVGDFSWNVGANFSLLKNVVTVLPQDINSGSFRSSGSVSRTSEGQPIASFYGYQTDGYWQTQEEVDAANENARALTGDDRVYFDTRQTSPGDVRFVDITGDGRVNSEDQTFIGSPHPDFTYGLNIDVSWKILDLKIFGQGVYGNELFFGPIYYLESPSLFWNCLSTMQDPWTQEGDQTPVPRLDINDGNQNLRFSDRYIYDGSYFRIKNVQLGVTLPQELSKTIGIEKARIYIAGQNLLTFTDYPGFDPEIGRGINRDNSAGQLDIGIDRGLYPIARSYMVGLNLTF